jgi:hypothetical protein
MRLELDKSLVRKQLRKSQKRVLLRRGLSAGRALLPGGTATFANYTSYSLGINGLMVDIQRLANPGGLTAADFQFKVGNDDTPSGWTTAPTPTSVTVQQGTGTDGSDRVTIIWDDNAIQNQWLQVTVLANANTGLAEDDEFYFGNAIGESGDQSGNAVVDVADETAAGDHNSGFSAAQIDSNYDYNRDGRVTVADVLIARRNHSVDPLQLIVAPAGGAAALAGGVSAAFVAVVPSVESSAEILKMTLPSPIENVGENHLNLVLADLLQRLPEPITSETPHHGSVSRFTDFQTLRIKLNREFIGKSNLPDSTQYLLHDAVFSDRSNWRSFARHRLPRHSTAPRNIDVNFEDCLLDDYEPGL